MPVCRLTELYLDHWNRPASTTPLRELVDYVLQEEHGIDLGTEVGDNIRYQTTKSLARRASTNKKFRTTKVLRSYVSTIVTRTTAHHLHSYRRRKGYEATYLSQTPTVPHDPYPAILEVLDTSKERMTKVYRAALKGHNRFRYTEWSDVVQYCYVQLSKGLPVDEKLCYTRWSCPSSLVQRLIHYVRWLRSRAMLTTGIKMPTTNLDQIPDGLWAALLRHDQYSLLPEVVEATGRGGFLKFMAVFSGQTITFPKFADLQADLQKMAIYKSWTENHDSAAITEEYGVSEREIDRIVTEVKGLLRKYKKYKPHV